MQVPILYKYRSLDNWRFLLDILVNSRLFAASFESLNNPMEGRYFEFGEDVSREFQRATYESLKQRRICSLTETPSNTLLWAHYGGGHRGVAIGVEVSTDGRSEIEVRKVTYDSIVQIHGDPSSRSPDAAALDILTQKQLACLHEEERRVFTAERFVPISIRELVLGCLIDTADEQLATTIAQQWHPHVRVSSWVEKR